MPLHVLPALASDLPHLITLQFAAFHTDPFMRILFPVHPPTPSTHAHALARLRADLLSDPTMHVLKVVDDTLPPGGAGAQIVSFAKWQLRPAGEEALEPRRLWGQGVNVEAADGFLDRLHEARARVLGGRACALLHILDTHPEHQRRGAGGMLVRWGTQKADEAGLMCYLEGSVPGYRLYRQNGFEDVEALEWGLEEWGGEGVCRFVCMIRPARVGGGGET